MKLSARKYAAFALITMTLSLSAMLVLLLAADLLVHWRAERSAGLNRWGYRGPVVGAKRAGELRAVMLGGSTVFGYGVRWNEAIPANLEQILRASRPFSVINLGYNNEGAYSFVPTLRDFDYLDYDIVVLYEGYNDLPGDEGPNNSVFRRDSAVFRLTGYFPLLPLYLEERAMMLRAGGDLNAAYAASAKGEKPKTVFRPNIAQRGSAAALSTISQVANSLGNQLGKLSTDPAPELKSKSRLGCTYPWVNYCESVHAAVRYALSHGKRVLVVGQPRMREPVTVAHQRQQHMLGEMIHREFAGETRVAYVDLGSAIDLSRSELSFDVMHLTAEGNRIVADALAPHVLEIAAP